jgi:hypothetical protein
MTLVPLLVLHSIGAMLLLGAISHQALAVWWGRRGAARGWWSALRAVHPERYGTAVVVLFAGTMLLGTLLYPTFRSVTRIYLDAEAPWATGLFELKEHAAAVGLALLPAYWQAWRDPTAGPAGRRALTTLLALLAWWNFVVGHVVNNARGL